MRFRITSNLETGRFFALLLQLGNGTIKMDQNGPKWRYFTSKWFWNFSLNNSSSELFNRVHELIDSFWSAISQAGTKRKFAIYANEKSGSSKGLQLNKVNYQEDSSSFLGTRYS